MKKLLISISIAALALLAGCVQNGDGEKIGTVVRVNKSGAICPTNEVEIVRGGLSNGTGAVGGIFDATVEDSALLQKLKDAMEHQQEVKITFTSEMFTLCRSGNPGSHFIRSVEVMNAPAPASNGLAPKVSGSRGDTIEKLLNVQAELLKELATK
jgi:hypothetical protein